jgi:hypothetical protein
MKQLKIAAIALLSVATFSLNAADPGDKELKVQVLAKADQTFKVIYEAEEKAAVAVTIYDANKQRIFSDIITNTDGFSKPYNFSNLPEGKYTFEIESNGVKSTEIVSNLKKESRPAMKAFVIPLKESGKFQLMVMSNNMSPVTISILDSDNKVLHKESVDSPETFGKVYDLSDIEDGEARFVVSSANHVLKDKNFNW